MSTRLFLLFVTRQVGESSEREARRTPKLRGQRPPVPGQRRAPESPRVSPPLRPLNPPGQEPPLARPPPTGGRGVCRQLLCKTRMPVAGAPRLRPYPRS